MFTMPETTREYACTSCGTVRTGRSRNMLGPCAGCGGFGYRAA